MNKNSKNPQKKNEKNSNSKLNEFGGIYFSSHIKISDPNTKEILVKKRGDN